MAMTKEQALAVAKARRRAAEAQQAQPQGDSVWGAAGDTPKFEYRGSAPDRFVRGVGSGVADIAGAPFDLMNAGLGLVGMDVERPWLGSENIEDWMGKVGLAPVEGVDKEAEDTLAGTLGQGTGNALGLLFPFMGAARVREAGKVAQAAPDAVSTGQRVINSLTKDAVTKPGVFAATEIGGGLGAAGGRYAARENGAEPGSPEDMAYQLFGGLAGGLAPSAVIGAGRVAKNASQVALVPAIARSVTERMRVARGGPYSTDTLNKAADVVQGQASNLDAATRSLANAEAPDGVRLSPAQQSQDPGLMALENRVNASSPARQQAAQQQQEGAVQRAEELFGGIGDNVPVARAGEELVRRRQEFAQRMDQRIQAAERRAKEAAQRIGDPRSRGLVSAEFNRNLEDAYRESSREVQQLWSRVDRSMPASADNIVGAFRQAMDDVGEAGRVFGGDVPGPLQRIMSQAQPEGNQTNIGELQELRRILGERGAAYRSGANPDRYRARIMDQLVKAIDQDFASVGDINPNRLPSGSVDVREAIAATRQLSERFRRDGIAKSMATSSTGGEQIPAEQVLERLLPVGSQGSSTRSLAGAREIYKAISESAGPVNGIRLPANSQAPRIHEGITEYFTGEFQRRAMTDGAVDVNKARRFLQDNAETLSLPQFSDLRVRLRNVTDAAQRGQLDQARAQQYMDRMSDPRQSRAAMFLGTDTADGTYQNAIANIVKGDARANMREIVRQVRKDPAGEAVKGLKTGFTRYALDQMRDRTGLPDGQRMSRIFSQGDLDGLPAQDQALARAARELFTPLELRDLRKAADVFRKIQASRAAGQTPESVNLGADGISRLAEISSQVMGANIGTAFGGAGGSSLQTASIGSSAFRDLATRLGRSPVDAAIGDAINDPELFRALLTRYPVKKMGFKDSHSKLLGSWSVQLPLYSEQEQQ